MPHRYPTGSGGDRSVGQGYPVFLRAAARSDDIADPQRNAVRPLSILVVEDDFDIREMIGEILECEGYRVRKTANGREALDALEDDLHAGCLPDLILLDLMMPELNGWGFRHEQLQDERIAAIPVVTVTAFASRLEQEHFPEARALITKPFGIETLLHVVGEALRKPN